MKNLFVMHTQYNLILSVAVMSRYKNAENILVLYSEFLLGYEMKKMLSEVFDDVIVVRDKFYTPTSALNEIKNIRQDLKKVKKVRNMSFDNIYMSQERIFDLILCARAKKINPQIKCHNIEEDAYYSINNIYNSENFVYKESFRLKRRKFLYSLLLFGYPYNYRDEHYCYGMSSEYDSANLLFPRCARKELKGKELSEITKNELVSGIKAIYLEKKINLPSSEKYTLFFFDLINRYKNVERIKQIVEEIVRVSQERGRTVLIKYHPREDNKFSDIEGVFEIPNIIPAEKVLLDIEGKDVLVVGNASTSCWVASKLGFRVVSIAKIEFPDNKKMHNFMSNIGILCVEDIKQLNDII